MCALFAVSMGRLSSSSWVVVVLTAVAVIENVGVPLLILAVIAVPPLPHPLPFPVGADLNVTHVEAVSPGPLRAGYAVTQGDE